MYTARDHRSMFHVLEENSAQDEHMQLAIPSQNLDLVAKSGISHKIWNLSPNLEIRSGFNQQIWKWEIINPDNSDQDNEKVF
ncbi:hypothetical protein TNCV_3365211 [Trichonephila clavipes]|nr:hypothetical protein TNCV_3365211 [Trichonephila clavipes]